MSTDESEDQAVLNDLETALAALAPVRGRLDRDRLMYEAGRAAARPSPRKWMAVAASLALVATGEGALLALRPEGRVVERVVVVREPAEPPKVRPVAVAVAVEMEAPAARPWEVGPGGRDRLAWQVLRYGLDGLPTSRASATSGPAPSMRALREEIGKVLELGDPS